MLRRVEACRVADSRTRGLAPQRCRSAQPACSTAAPAVAPPLAAAAVRRGSGEGSVASAAKPSMKPSHRRRAEATPQPLSTGRDALNSPTGRGLSRSPHAGPGGRGHALILVCGGSATRPLNPPDHWHSSDIRSPSHHPGRLRRYGTSGGGGEVVRLPSLVTLRAAATNQPPLLPAPTPGSRSHPLLLL